MYGLNKGFGLHRLRCDMERQKTFMKTNHALQWNGIYFMITFLLCGTKKNS